MSSRFQFAFNVPVDSTTNLNGEKANGGTSMRSPWPGRRSVGAASVTASLPRPEWTSHAQLLSPWELVLVTPNTIMRPMLGVLVYPTNVTTSGAACRTIW